MKNVPFVKKYDENGLDNFPSSGVYPQPHLNRKNRRFEESLLKKVSQIKNETGKENALKKLRVFSTPNVSFPLFGKSGHWESGHSKFFKGKIAVRS